ncbi:MSCRAMM family protein [Halanaerobacter jeridensis]|uniref:Protocatechuate 3,4-dioxygenase beta subunit n=1 Tax=Halanaerobacter jeridensis TaxID=706427 RepID=A0A939BSB7_9FIRM|nr:carboxypeptidase-like regulatory domain-containing protein [Halanaerobacter jeridensis]MBM7558189.1 protocatechuate 3,4-dioxygenase beta subunit [Halanaerobacter jeridensis]
MLSENSYKKLIILFILVMMASSFLLIGCSNESSNKGEYSISGTIYDNNGNPVPEVTIKFNGELSLGKSANFGMAKTDENGQFSKTGLTGTVEVIPVKEGYDFSPQTVTGETELVFGNDEDYNTDDKEEKDKFDFKIRTTNISNKELGQVSIELKNNKLSYSKTKETDNNGEVIFKNLQAGLYNIKAEKSKYITVKMEIDLEEEQSKTIKLAKDEEKVTVTDNITEISNGTLTVDLVENKALKKELMNQQVSIVEAQKNVAQLIKEEAQKEKFKQVFDFDKEDIIGTSYCISYQKTLMGLPLG